MMTKSLFVRSALATSLALALAACGEEAAESALEGDVVAEVPAPEGTSWSQTAVRTEDGGWQIGNPDAPIKLIEYGSLTCPGCVAFSLDASEKLHKEYVDSGRVSFEFRSAPIHGWPDLLMTRMLECAPLSAGVPLADQIWANYETLMGGFQARSAEAEQTFGLPPEQRFVALGQVSGITDFFAARGISSDQAEACLTDASKVEGLAEKLQQSMTDADITGTPTFLLNGQKLNVSRWSDLEPMLQRAGARPE